MTAELLTGGEALVRSLVDHGVHRIFGIPGSQTYGLFDAIGRAEGAIGLVTPRHEQTAAYMAFGYAQSTGRPATFSVVPGPGVLNASAAMLTALGCNAPVLCLTGQVPAAYIGRGRGHLHEMPDQLGTLRQFTKWAARIEHPALAPVRVAEAFRAMLSGRRGPAALEMPWDHFTMRGPVPRVPPRSADPSPPYDADAVEGIAEALASAHAPMIMVGGGAVGAAPDVTALAEALGAPVVAFRSGLGVVDASHDLSLTIASGRHLWDETDLLLGIGTRLEVPEFRWRCKPAGLRVARIDIDPAEFTRVPASLNLLADAVDGCRWILQSLQRRGHSLVRSRRDRCIAARTATESAISAVQPQVDYLRVIRDAMPSDGFLVDEMCQAGFASWFAFPVHRPRGLVTSGYQGTLGFGFPTALGVKVAHPSRAVVSITGDGGFMFAVPELATAVQYGIGVVTIVFDNAGFGNVRRDQQQMFGGRVVGAELRNPDFIRLAESFGVPAVRVRGPEALRAPLACALERSGPSVIVVDVPPGSEASPWRFLHPEA